MLLVLAMLLSIGALAAPAEDLRPDPYQDVDETLWSYAYIVDLYEDGILPEGEMLYRVAMLKNVVSQLAAEDAGTLYYTNGSAWTFSPD